ncbi:peptidoglycan recognition protein family protein [Falsiroseomonas sp. HC035]|uniref:peptidoglycan recognition protein family protein n=1 Tax=Falsiroseomonas sp. HC035 TaxID=3390999 RepID=UPI003D320D22
MKRVICHWTAGQHKASALDHEHYHILIEADGRLVRGTHSIEDNVSTKDKVYAAHTLGCNTGSIGVAACCMAEAHEKPFKGGRSPMLRKQWDTMAAVVAELCRFYRIPVSPTTVLGHGEVEIQLGIKQRGKWDPMMLPWNPDLSKTEVGNAFRALVQSALEGGHPVEGVREVSVVVGGKAVGSAFMADGGTWAAAREIAHFLNWTVAEGEDDVRFTGVGSPPAPLPAIEMNGQAHVDIEDLTSRLGRKIAWDPASRTVTVA